MRVLTEKEREVLAIIRTESAQATADDSNDKMKDNSARYANN